MLQRCNTHRESGNGAIGKEHPGKGGYGYDRGECRVIIPFELAVWKNWAMRTCGSQTGPFVEPDFDMAGAVSGLVKKNP